MRRVEKINSPLTTELSIGSQIPRKKYSLFLKAGIASSDDPEQLLIALEPEAASVYCREKKMRDFASERGDANVSDVFARPGSRYLVIDIGGNDSMRFKFEYIYPLYIIYSP